MQAVSSFASKTQGRSRDAAATERRWHGASSPSQRASRSAVTPAARRIRPRRRIRPCPFAGNAAAGVAKRWQPRVGYRCRLVRYSQRRTGRDSAEIIGNALDARASRLRRWRTCCAGRRDLWRPAPPAATGSRAWPGNYPWPGRDPFAKARCAVDDAVCACLWESERGKEEKHEARGSTHGRPRRSQGN